MQLITACFDAFSFGANDVSNAAGPLTAVWATYETGEIVDKPTVNTWVMLFCTAGLVLGILFFGSRVIQTIGTARTYFGPLLDRRIILTSFFVQ